MNALGKSTPIKKCQHCQRLLPATSFYQYKRSNDGLDIYCKECRDAMDRERVKNALKVSEKAKKDMDIKTKKKEQDPAILYSHIQHVSDEDLVKELRRRGYTGSLEFSKTVTI